MARCCRWFRRKHYTDFDEEAGRSNFGNAPPPQTLGRQSLPTAEILEKKIDQSKKTRVLAMRECGLKLLPKGACDDDMAVLRTADLGVNALSALPEAISAWKGLQKLQCEKNELIELPSSIGQLIALEQMVLSNNLLRSLPATLGNLGKLRILSLNCNSLGPQLPDVFGNELAASLSDLDLSENRLVHLAPSLSQLVALSRLNLACNELCELHESLGGLAKLACLDASQNKLRAVPPALLRDTRLNDLNLKGNPIDRLELQKTPCFDAFLARRQARIDAKISSNVVGDIDLSMCGLD